MQLIDPDILARMLPLSVAACATGVTVGFLLWLLGWQLHRFWIVLFTTVVAGIIGLSSGKATGVQPFVIGLLLAIAAGTMALALARLLAFAAGGVATMLLVPALAPQWNEPVLCFLVGGLAGLILFREWTMALTSLGGTLLMTYFGLCLAEHLGKLGAQEWAEQRTQLLNWICGGLTLLGLAVQFFLERWRVRRSRLYEAQMDIERAEHELEHRYRKRNWWWGPFRRAA